ncbi:MAG TPA: acyl-CoA dehydrogenase family protein [Caulobacteraceae bacterium]|jgi:acyl-CoA dehydrogenase|nr:acyl-CoA dehydrogenase family protein [Caulobacteraceae bacterium]
MDLDLDAKALAFRDEVRAFLDAELTDELRRAARRATSVFTEPQFSLPWQRILHRRGWVAPSWPKAYGGTGWDETQRYVFAAECARAGAPGLAPMGLRMVAPVIMSYGTAEQKAELLPRILSGEDYWCQGYSEPGAGSDLAALQLAATRDGEDYVLTGSKIWTTHAHHANRMFCLVRTRREGKPQAGITFLLLDMATPGISVRPLITLAGDHEVNQVFFDAVRVPAANRLGQENDGWTVAKALLEFERGGGGSPGLRVALERLVTLASIDDGVGRPIDQPGFRRKLAEIGVRLDALEISELRILTSLSAGQSPGAVSSIMKVQTTELMQAIDELALQALGTYAAVQQTEARAPDANIDFVGPEAGLTVTPRYLNDRAGSIYGGSNEIQRNIVARLILGL